MIPKIIHQIWIGSAQMDDISKTCTEKVKELYESHGWEYILHGNDKLNYYLKTIPSELVKNVCLNNNFIYSVDLMKYLILSEYGGFISDADNFPIQVVSDSILNNDFVISRYNDSDYGNSFIGSTSKNEIIEDISSINNIENRFKKVLSDFNVQNEIIEKKHYLDNNNIPTIAITTEMIGCAYLKDVLRKYPDERFFTLPPIVNFINNFNGAKYNIKNLNQDIISKLIAVNSDITNIHMGTGCEGWIIQCYNGIHAFEERFHNESDYE